ncbi:MAG: autotransporter domain-containing protein [Phycisphaerales bacterium]|nr:autotransporter domain-containing protein [Phycisphaerales bacterium]
MKNWTLAGMLLFVAVTTQAAVLNLPDGTLDGDDLPTGFSYWGHGALYASHPDFTGGSDLSGASAVYTNFTDSDFTGADFSGADLNDANLSGVNFTNANLVGTLMTNAAITAGTDFTNADIAGDFGTSAAGAGFRGLSQGGVWPAAIPSPSTNVSGRGISRAQLTSTASYTDGSTGFNGNLQMVDISRSDLSTSTGGYAAGTFETMDLRGTNFNQSKLDGQSFTGSNLDGAWFAAAYTAEEGADPSQERKVILDPGAIDGALSIVGASFNDMDLTGQDFTGKDFEDVDFAGSKLPAISEEQLAEVLETASEVAAATGRPISDDNVFAIDLTLINLEDSAVDSRLPLVWDERLTKQVERHAYAVLSDNAHAMAFEPGMGVSDMLASAASDADAIAMSLGAEMAVASPADEVTRLAEGTVERKAPTTRRPSTRPANLGTATIWAMPYGVMNDHKDANSRMGYEFCAYGIAAGVDMKVSDNFLLGFAFSYEHKTIDFSHGQGDGDMDSYRFGPYASFRDGPAFLTASVNLGLHTTDYRRYTDFGEGGDHEGDFSMWDITAAMTVGYDIALAPGTTLTPMGTVTYSFINRESFKEDGQLLTAVDYDAVRECALSTRLGARLSHKGELLGMPANLQLEAGWQHEYLYQSARVSGTLQGQDLLGGFKADVETTAPDVFYYGVGFGMRLDSNTSMAFRYQGQMASDMVEHLGSVSFVWNY